MSNKRKLGPVPVYTSLIDGKKRQVGTAIVNEGHVEYTITDPEAIALIKDDSFEFSIDQSKKNTP